MEQFSHNLGDLFIQSGLPCGYSRVARTHYQRLIMKSLSIRTLLIWLLVAALVVFSV